METEQVIDGRAITSGTVTFEDQPLPAGAISFTSQDDPTLRITTAIRSGGKFLTDRAPIGKNIVTIETESIKDGSMAAYVPIPAKYNNAATSGLEADIQPGENENIDFALEK